MLGFLLTQITHIRDISAHLPSDSGLIIRDHVHGQRKILRYLLGGLGNRLLICDDGLKLSMQFSEATTDTRMDAHGS